MRQTLLIIQLPRHTGGSMGGSAGNKAALSGGGCQAFGLLYHLSFVSVNKTCRRTRGSYLHHPQPQTAVSS